MAAGRGTRISRQIYENPKCTLDVAGTPLIKRTVELLQRNSISDVALVVGYRPQIIQICLVGQSVKYYYNPFFDVTNSAASLWFAKDFLKDDQDLMLMNGDLFLEQNLLDMVLSESKPLVLFSDESRKEQADYKLQYADGKLIAHGKDLSSPNITGEYVGIAKVQRDFIPQFTRRLDEMVFSQRHEAWWEDVLYSFIGQTDVYVEPVGNRFWAEIDFIEDYQRILQFVRQPKRATT